MLEGEYPRPPAPQTASRTGEKTEERRMINVEEQIDFSTMPYPKGWINFITENDVQAIKACPFWSDKQSKDWAGVMSYIKQQEIETGRCFGDDEKRREPITETLAVLQDRLKNCKAEDLKTIIAHIKELQIELNEPGEPLPSFLLEAYLIAYRAWIAATAVNQPFLLEKHVGGNTGGGNNGHG